ncbi:MAG: hypothetical protein U0Q55_19355 [Vicinamibacterales bacterium]
MINERFVAIALALTVAASAVPSAQGQYGQSASLAGTAKDEAKKPYTDYTVRARDVNAPKGEYAKSTSLDNQGAFSLTDLTTKSYLVELVNKKGDVVCTEGPFDLSKQAVKSDVFIECGKIPAAWWLVGAAAAAGVTAGIVAGGDASPAR